jgi:hypothetical protein
VRGSRAFQAGDGRAHQSDSDAQRRQSTSDEQLRAEPLILSGIATRLGVDLVPRSLSLPRGARVDVDGVAPDESVFVEVFAHQGRLRGGQFHKVARDALKLITLAQSRREARLVIAFADEDAAKCVTGKSWLAEALSTWEIEVIVVDLEAVVRQGLRAAQARQVMVNAPLER